MIHKFSKLVINDFCVHSLNEKIDNQGNYDSHFINLKVRASRHDKTLLIFIKWKHPKKKRREKETRGKDQSPSK